MARDIAKCARCGAIRFEEEVILDRTIWDYVCRDTFTCEQSDPKMRDMMRERYRKKKGLSRETINTNTK